MDQNQYFLEEKLLIVCTYSLRPEIIVTLLLKIHILRKIEYITPYMGKWISVWKRGKMYGSKKVEYNVWESFKSRI